MMPAVACATVGLPRIARSIACWKVRRSRPCAGAEFAAMSTIAATVKPRRPAARTKHAKEALRMACGLFSRRGSWTGAANRLNHHIQDRNEQDVEERREEHPARDRGADRMAAFLPRA